MLASITQSHYWTVAGWTMLHFVWIGGLVGLFALIGKAVLRSASPNSRYIFGLACLGILAVTPVGTFVYLAETLPAEPVMALAGDVESSGILPAPEIIIPAGTTIHQYPSEGTDDRDGAESLVGPPPSGSASSLTQKTTVDRLVARVNPVLTTAADVAPWLWMIGAPLVFLLLATGLIGAERLKKTADQITEGPIYELSVALSQSLNVAGKVTVGISRKVASPVLVGIVRPMILLPPIALTGWTASQIEMVLLHELSHVRRWDNLVNLVQRAIEALLFFHPAVWLISRWVRLEREHCCDAIVLARGSKPQSYAEMLFSMATTPRMDQAAVAMSQNDLVPRIRRILQLEPTVMKYSRTLIVTVAAAVVATSLGAGAFASQGEEPEDIEEIIIDDTDSRVTWKGNWEQRDASKDKYGTHYRFTTHDKGDLSATFTPEIETPGVYEVYAWWPEGWNRTSFAEYQVTHRDGTSRVTRNQRQNGGQWNLLGRAWFDKGTKGYVSVTNNTPGWADPVVIADAVKFKYISDDRRVEPAFLPENDDFPVPGEVEKYLDLTVVDSKTGKPLDHVYVLASYGGFWGNWSELLTDEKGFSQIPIPARDTKYLTIGVRESGYAPVRVEWYDDELSTVPNRLELALEPAVKIGGIVVDEEGNPIQGVSVRVYARDEQRREGNILRDWLSEDLTTDSQGRWVCENFPHRLKKVNIDLSHPDFVLKANKEIRNPLDKKLKTLNWVDTLQAGAFVEGRVVDADGSPVAHAEVIRGRSFWGVPDMIRTTDADGRFRFTGLTHEEEYLTVTAYGHAPAVQPIHVVGKEQSVEIQLEPGHVLRCRVEDQFGDPVVNAMIHTNRWRGLRTLEWGTRTDSEGRFVWTGAPADEFSISIQLDGYEEKQQVSLVAGNEEIVIPMKRGLLLKGSVTDAQTGAPVPAFLVRIGSLQEGDASPRWVPYSGRSCVDGTYEITLLKPDSNVISVEADGYQPLVSSVFTGKTGELVYDVELQPGSGLSGIIQTPDGKPASNVDVIQVATGTPITLDNGRIQNYYSEGVHRFVTDAKGSFTLPARPCSSRILCSSDQGFAVATDEQLAESGVLTLQPWGRIEGTYSLGSKLVAGGRVTLTVRYDNPIDMVYHHYVATTDDEGRFSFDRVFPGDVKVCNSIEYPTGMQRYSTYLPVLVESGETYRVTLGGIGCPVTGKLDIPADIQPKVKSPSSRISLQKYYPEVPDIPSDVIRRGMYAVVQWHLQWEQTADGLAAQNKCPQFSIKLNSDFTFRTEDVPAGKYELSVKIYEPPSGTTYLHGALIAEGNAVVEIPGMEGGRSDEPFDIGVIPVEAYQSQPAARTAVGARNMPFPCMDGKLRRLSDYKGKVILLNNSSHANNACEADYEILKSIRDQYVDNPNFVMIGTHTGESVEKAERYLKQHDLDWPHVFIDQSHADSFNGVFGTEVNCPSYYILIYESPDESRLNLPIEKLQDEIKKALKEIEQ